jgi:bacterioferritin
MDYDYGELSYDHDAHGNLKDDSKETFIQDLQMDLSLERAARVQYLAFASLLTGPESLSLQDEFKDHAHDEGKHEKKLLEIIVYLGGVPDTRMAYVDVGQGNDTKFALIQTSEELALSRYKKRYKDAESLGLCEILDDLLDILGDERSHLNDIKSVRGI